MEQRFSEPSTADLEQLAKQRAVVEARVGDRERYVTTDGKLAILTELAGTLAPTQTYELQCLGIVLGDVFVERRGWQWRMVEDEYGRDPCIVIPGTTVALFPLTMISKRVEQGEPVDVAAIFEQIARGAAQLAAPQN